MIDVEYELGKPIIAVQDTKSFTLIILVIPANKENTRDITFDVKMCGLSFL